MSNLLYTTAREIIELSSTMLEGLKHINQRMTEGHLENTLYLFQDVVDASNLINSLLKQLPEDEQVKALEEISLKFQESMDLMLLAYKSNNLERAHGELQYDLLPNFRKWQFELGKSLKPYKDS